MGSKIFFAALGLLCLSSACMAANWSDCGADDGSDDGSLVNVVVQDCTGARCNLIRGQNSSLEITFKTRKPTKGVTAAVFGEVLGARQPFFLANAKACEEVGLPCPLEADSTYTYKNSVFVKPSYPRVTVEISWELHDDDGKLLFCAKIPAKIVKDDKK